MAKFRLSRKRKKRYQKDLTKAYCAHWLNIAKDNIHNKPLLLGCGLLLSGDKMEIKKSQYSLHKSRKSWEWFYFRRRVDVSNMEVILTYPDYNKEMIKYEFDPKLAKPATNEQLLMWYKEHYPNDKLSHHFCQQNRHRFE